MSALPPSVTRQAMEEFSTGGMPAARRAAYWNDVAARMEAPHGVQTRNAEDFYCTMGRGFSGNFVVSHVSASDIETFRDKRHLHHGDYTFLSLQMEGSAELATRERRSVIKQGCLMLIDPDTPYRYSSLSPITVVAIGFPPTSIATRLPNWGALSSCPIDGEQGLGRVVASTLQSIGDVFLRGNTFIPRAFFLSLLDMLSSMADEIDGSETSRSTPQKWACRVKSFIEQNLRDPELSPALMSQELGISPRYLRLIFGDEGDPKKESLRRYVLRRRLEECAIDLANPKLRHSSITDLSFGWGFSDSSYFSRRFWEYFGCTPREYRAAGGLGPCPGLEAAAPRLLA